MERQDKIVVRHARKSRQMRTFERSRTRYDVTQIDCLVCRGVAALQLRAGDLRRRMKHAFSLATIAQGPPGEHASGQNPTFEWTLAINSSLQQAIAEHPRCAACGILMGPGHTEAGEGGRCQTHTEGEPPRPLVAEAPDDSLDWIAGLARR